MAGMPASWAPKSDADSRLYAFKTGNSSYGDGRRYFFHNTLLQKPPPAGSTFPSRCRMAWPIAASGSINISKAAVRIEMLIGSY